MNSNVSCPIDFVSINENRVRLVALLVLALAGVYLWSGWWGIIAFLVVDFALRSFNLNQYSPLATLAGGLVKLLNIPGKPTDRAPKRFAARMGLAFNTVILAFNFAQFNTLVILLTLILCFFAFLESFWAFVLAAMCIAFTAKLLQNNTTMMPAF